MATVSYHRVIAEAFHPNPNGKACVNHINGNKLDNRPENLEWCSYAENTAHAVATGLIQTGSRYASGVYDDRIKKSIVEGVLQLNNRVVAEIPDSHLEAIGIDPLVFRALPAKTKSRMREWPTEDLIEMNRTMSMTRIAQITGYSLAAVSRKIRGQRK